MKSYNFIGVRVDALRYADMFRAVDDWLAHKESRSHHIAPINVFCVTLALTDPKLADIYASAGIAGPDGMPFVRWIRRFLAVPCDRFYAPDIVVQLAQRARERDYTFYLYGGDPEVAEGMKCYLQQRFPYLRIVGVHSPPFRALTEEEDRAICEEIGRLQPDFVCVGLGTPKQDYFIAEHLHKVKGAVFIGCGATFDFFGGRVRMAPRWIQQSGFEWLYRLLGPDFKRLWRRYTLNNVVFLWFFGLQLLGLWSRRPPTPDTSTRSV